MTSILRACAALAATASAALLVACADAPPDAPASPAARGAAAPDELVLLAPDAGTIALDAGGLLALRFATYDHSGQATHPDYAFAAARPAARRRHLVLTPYPGGDSKHENPSIFRSADGVAWSRDPRTPAPLARPERAPNAYLSDPDVVYVPERDELWVYYRAVRSDNVVYVIRSKNDVQWTKPVEVARAHNHELVSPAVVRRAPDDWMMWSVNARAGCEDSLGTIELRRSTDGLHFGAPTPVQLEAPSPFVPWHIEVQWIASRREYWALFNAKLPGTCTTPFLYLATSPDGVTWTTFPQPVLKRNAIPEFHDIVYRSTFDYDPATDVITFWYSGAAYLSGVWTWRVATQKRPRAALFADIARPEARGAARIAVSSAPMSDAP